VNRPCVRWDTETISRSATASAAAAAAERAKISAPVRNGGSTGQLSILFLHNNFLLFTFSRPTDKVKGNCSLGACVNLNALIDFDLLLIYDRRNNNAIF
jgi:hypothetical protein